MTLLNYWISPDKAIVAVDTQVMPLGEPDNVRDMSKILYLPHANVLLAGRGSVDVLYAVYLPLLQFGTDFDRIRDRLQIDLATISRTFRAYMDQQGTPIPNMKQELVLVGYSSSSKAMGVRRFTIDEAGLVISDSDQGDTRPDVDHQRRTQWLQNPSSADAMLRLAQEQVAWADSKKSGSSFGGRLLCAELTKDALHMSSIGRLREGST